MPEIILHEQIACALTPSDLLSNQGMIFFESPQEIFDLSIDLFSLKDKGFNFSVSISPLGICISRNNSSKTLQYNEIDFNKHSPCRIAFAWDPTNIGVAVNGSLHGIEIFPSPTPTSLIRWARKQLLIPSTQFPSSQDMSMRINEGVNLIQNKIITSSAYHSFWDKTFGKNGKLEKLLPKREPDVQPLLNCFLMDQMLQSNVEIVPEFRTGKGNVDFALIGNIKDYGSAKHFIEVKNGHSSDLIHGFTNQLPDYMEANGVVSGTYLVLCYHGAQFDNPDSSPDRVFERLYDAKKKVNQLVLERIRISCLDLSKPRTASKQN